MSDLKKQTALGDVAARQLAVATRTVPQMVAITPRWLTHLLNWIPVESGVYRLNKVKDGSIAEVDCSGRDERELPHTFIDYVENPREYNLSAVNTVLDVHTRVSDLYSKPYNQNRHAEPTPNRSHRPNHRTGRAAFAALRGIAAHQRKTGRTGHCSGA